MSQRSVRHIAMLCLAFLLILSSAVPAFADSKSRGFGNGHGKHKFEIEKKGKGHARGHLKQRGTYSFTLEYDDVNQEARWAQKYIASLAAKKVFEGYEDGFFRPNKPVTRIEAVTAAVRLMGLRDEAEDKDNWKQDINLDDERQIRKHHNWAVGYVVVAQEEGLLAGMGDRLQPQKPASRLWVTELIVRALDLAEEAEDQADAKLKFRDANDIPKDKRGFVKVAVDEGIITGDDKGKFQPNKPVTRAELAAMLERAEGRLIDETSDEAARGTVVREVSNDTLVLELNGKITRYALDPHAFIFRDGKKVPAKSLEKGDKVFIRSYNQLVIFVEVLQSADKEDDDAREDSFYVIGNFKSLTLNRNGKIHTITIVAEDDDETRYKVSSNVHIEGDVEELEEGREIELFVKEGIVEKITIDDFTFRIKGELDSYMLNSRGQIATLSIRHTVRGKEQISVFHVSSDVKIRGDLESFEDGEDIVIYGSKRRITESGVD